MLTLKRLLVIVTTLLCALSIAACSGPSNANAQGAAANSSNSGVSTTNEIAKESTQSQSQASKQTTTNKQTTNQANTNQSTQVTTSVNNSQQASGQTTVTQNTQSSQQNTSSQNNNNQNNQNNSNQQKQASTQNNSSQNNNNKHQTSSGVNNSSNYASSSNNNNSSTSNNSSGTNTYIKVAQVNINGQMTNVLTNGNGMTLYYDTNDSSTNATCTGNCAQTWHPLLAQGQVITSNGLTSGRITQQATANGNQVEYNGHPLYTYTNDTAAGQVNGQGVNNVWNAASMVTVQAAHW